LPLMATAVVAHGVSRSVAPVPLYHALAHGWLRRAEKRTHEKHPPPAPPVAETPAAAGSVTPAAAGSVTTAAAAAGTSSVKSSETSSVAPSADAGALDQRL
ncbi:MAG: hypothetical protein KAX54_04455, partial [Thauera sp.]|nr:hypothetical protein [Thauera sp.]